MTVACPPCYGPNTLARLPLLALGLLRLLCGGELGLYIARFIVGLCPLRLTDHLPVRTAGVAITVNNVRVGRGETRSCGPGRAARFTRGAYRLVGSRGLQGHNMRAPVGRSRSALLR